MTTGDSSLIHHWRRMAKRLQVAAGEVRLAHPLSRLTTLQIGGPAQIVCQVKNTEAARRFLDFAQANGLPWVCLGGGSNILADDCGYAGMVLLIQNRQFTVQGDTVRVGAGWPVDDLVIEALKAGLTGLEFAGGLPGTIGGALVGNAGCYGLEIGSFLVEATVLRRDGRLLTLGRDDFAFEYRASAIKSAGDVVLDAVLALSRGDAARAAAIRNEHIADRRRKHPWSQPSAGSYFKNLPSTRPGEPRKAAGGLLEAAGAKNMSVGGAAVFPEHANIIINTGGATSRDVLMLADRMRASVQLMFGVELEPEVVHLATPDAGP